MSVKIKKINWRVKLKRKNILTKGKRNQKSKGKIKKKNINFD
jgi:hypothetical protein